MRLRELIGEGSSSKGSAGRGADIGPLRIRVVGSSGRGVNMDSGAVGDVRICDLTEDSRTVMPGSLFIARKGEKSDGRKYVAQAIKAGAVAVLCDDEEFALPEGTRGVVLLLTDDIQLASAVLGERFYGDPTSSLILIGVTGTNGKTTTAFLIHQILNAVGVRCGLIGTVCIDDGTSVEAAELTTPPALELSRTFARMTEAGCRAAVMEVSSHALHQRRVGALRFRAGVFTNLTGDHLDYHGTMEEYGTAKAMLFAMLPPEREGGLAVVNIQDASHTRMIRDCNAGVLRCAIELPLGISTGGGGCAPETICRARVTSVSTGSTTVTMTGPWGAQEMRLPVVGMFNVMNALQAAATVYGVLRGTAEQKRAGGVDVSFAVISEALAHATPPPGRLEPVTRDGDPIAVFVDYAHTDDALRTVLATLRESMRGGSSKKDEGKRERKLICVFGCGGDRDRSKRPRMGSVAAELADLVVVTSDNPRTEDPDVIIREILGGIDESQRDRVTIEPDRERAIRAAVRRAAAGGGGDVVVIAGKGHEDYQILRDPKRPGQTITRHFDDREVARDALRARGLAARPAVPLCGVYAEGDSGSSPSSGDVTDVLFESDQM